jgi:hypothetical protein
MISGNRDKLEDNLKQKDLSIILKSSFMDLGSDVLEAAHMKS